MKKSMLCAGLLAVLGATHAAQTDTSTTTPNNAGSSNNQATTPAQQTPQTVLPLSATQGTNAPASVHTTPGPIGNGNNNNATTTTTTPAQGTTTPTTAPASQTQTQPVTTIPSTTATPAAAQAMDCNFKIPATTATVDQSVVLKWAQNAAEQSFEFDFNSIDNQLGILKTCFTDQGWQGFNDALQKSGNLNAIKTEKLMVSSMVDGTASISVIKDNQWRVIVPLQVVYQNDKEKLTQPLSVSLVVGRKVSGDLGIMQMIATPRQPMSTTPAATTPSTTPATGTAPVTQ